MLEGYAPRRASGIEPSTPQREGLGLAGVLVIAWRLAGRPKIPYHEN